MALAIDPTPLARNGIPDIQTYLDRIAGHTRRFQVYRVCAHATILHDASTARRLHEAGGRLAKQEAMDWQADQDDDLDEMEVFQHLNHQAKTSPRFREALLSQTERTNATVTTLVTSCAVQSPSLTASAHGSSRPLSSFHRYSLRESILILPNKYSFRHGCSHPEDICSALVANDGWFLWSDRLSAPRIVGATFKGNELPGVFWHLQFDFVNLLSPRILPTSRPGKRRQTTLNPFHQVSSAPVQHSSPGFHHLPEARRFKRVRYRPDRRTWVAEMKPPKYKNKVSFGDFKCPAQAARVVDAAFHYYGKPHLLHFPDTPHILSTRPMLPAGLGEEDKLRFVKEQAKWMASIASALPSSPPWAPPEIPEPSSSRACTLGFGSFSEITSFLSCGDADEAHNAMSQPQPSCDAVMGPVEEQQGVFEWSLEDAFVDPCLLPDGWSPSSSSVQITDAWDHGAEDCSARPATSNFVNSSQPSESQGSWINYLVMSPPAAMIPMPPSPTNFHRDAAHALCEQESFGGEWLSG